MKKQKFVQTGLGLVIILIQIFDIIIHAATNQLEPLRVVSNLVILAWIVVMISGSIIQKTRSLALASIGIYLGLNLIFLILAGVTNEGEPRVMLFLLLILTSVLSAVLSAALTLQPKRHP